MLVRPVVLVVFALLCFGGPEDLANLQGEWQMVSGRRDGADMPEASVKQGHRTCKDNHTTVIVAGTLIMKADFTLDASKNPKTIDYDVKAGALAGKKQLGIYKIEQHTVTFCFAAPDQPRPDDFVSNAGDGRTLSVWTKDEAHPR
jgi:uncharacterized protein (TIGR03067 family)